VSSADTTNAFETATGHATSVQSHSHHNAVAQITTHGMRLCGVAKLTPARSVC